jgi:hypothetical protein
MSPLVTPLINGERIALITGSTNATSSARVLPTSAGGRRPASSSHEPCTFASSGDGGPATNAGLRAPLAVSATADGRYLIADAGAARIRKVSAGVGARST